MSTPAHPIEGVWQPLKAELSGEYAPDMVLERMSLILNAGRYSVHFGGELSDRGAYTINVVVPHSVITLTGEHGANRGKTIPAIFQLVGDRLRVCYGLEGQLPAAFVAGATTRFYLVSYRRKNS